MIGRRTWTWCAVAGVLTFVASFLFGQIPGLKPCGPSGGLSAILAFEFVRSPAEVAALFGSEPCRSALVAAQQTGLLLDGLWFIPSYSAFLLLAAAGAGGKGWRVSAGMAMVAGLSDEVEGGLLAMILSALPGTQPTIDALWVAVHLKFALLAVATLGVGLQLIASGRPVLARAAGIAAAIMGAFALLRLVQGQAAEMMLSFAIGWTVLLLVAAVGAVRPSALAARGDPLPVPVPPAA